MLCCFFFCLSACLANPPALPWNAKTQGGFVTCLCRDGRGSVFVGTEDFGLWRYSLALPAGHQWTQFHGKEDYGQDSCYALCCDALGRVWCGGLHGLSVFSGGQWRHFTPLNGPLGYRVFALTTSPVDGDIWGATEAGLFRYSLSQNTWACYTMLDGLPTDAVQSLCFDAKGVLYVGTQADGICLSSAASDFHDWAKVPGPASMPSAPTGEGLPSSLINCLYAARDGTIYAGTNCGLAGSRDNGQTWHFLRGADWKAKVLGLYHGPAPRDPGTRGNLLTEDYVTCVSEDGAGRLWVGHRQKSVEVRDERTGRRLPTKAIAKILGITKTIGGAFVTALLPTPDGTMLVGGYGSGLTQAGTAIQGSNPPAERVTTVNPLSPLPAYAKPPTLSELNDLLAQVAQVKPEVDPTKPLVIALDDDWQTRGDWLGRYGRYWACLCAMCSPQDYLWGAGWDNVEYSATIGPNADGKDYLRYWVHQLYLDNPSSLEMPVSYLHSRIIKGLTSWGMNRRESEQDDHGEAYPMWREGPNIYMTLTVPKGLYYLSVYDFNKDGHSPPNWLRDYRLSIKSHYPGRPVDDLRWMPWEPELAHSRIFNFWSGVWKRFLVRGPNELTIEVNRNNSFNTILPGVMLDLVDEKPAPYFKPVTAWQAEKVKEEVEQAKLRMEPLSTRFAPFVPCKSQANAANVLFALLENVRLTNPAWWAANRSRYYGPLVQFPI